MTIFDFTNMILDYDSGICLRPLASKYGISPATAKKYLNEAGVDTSKKRCYTKAVWDLITAINTVLDEFEGRLTVRQIYYQLASRHIVPLSKKGYNSVVSAANKGRKHGHIDWDKIEDRTRQPHTVPMWEGVDDFAETVLSAYRRDIWGFQPEYFEVWLEKNALFGVINPITSNYGITLQTITGYSSISAIYDGAGRFIHYGGGEGTILYLGDHDATGVDIDRSIKDSLLEDHGLDIAVERVGLLYEDIEKFNLPPNPIKESDPRSSKYPYEKQAELDALSPAVLIDRVESAILDHLDLDAYNECREIEAEELNAIRTRFGDVQGGGV